MSCCGRRHLYQDTEAILEGFSLPFQRRANRDTVGGGGGKVKKVRTHLFVRLPMCKPSTVTRRKKFISSCPWCTVKVDELVLQTTVTVGDNLSLKYIASWVKEAASGEILRWMTSEAVFGLERFFK